MMYDCCCLARFIPAPAGNTYASALVDRVATKRFIPAPAGNTSIVQAKYTCCCSPVHPRARGEHRSVQRLVELSTRNTGSSPRPRGTPVTEGELADLAFANGSSPRPRGTHFL